MSQTLYNRVNKTMKKVSRYYSDPDQPDPSYAATGVVPQDGTLASEATTSQEAPQHQLFVFQALSYVNWSFLCLCVLCTVPVPIFIHYVFLCCFYFSLYFTVFYQCTVHLLVDPLRAAFRLSWFLLGFQRPMNRRKK